MLCFFSSFSFWGVCSEGEGSLFCYEYSCFLNLGFWLWLLAFGVGGGCFLAELLGAVVIVCCYGLVCLVIGGEVLLLLVMVVMMPSVLV